MDFELTDDQVVAAGGDPCVLRRPVPTRRRAQHRARGGRLDRELWHELGDTGVFSLRVPEDDGGLGLGVAEAVLVFEELGRALVPGPLVATELAARISPEAAAGHVVVGLLDRSDELRDELVVMEHPADLDALLVLDGDGVHLVDPDVIDGVDAERPLDALTPIRLVTSAVPDGELVGDPEAAASLRREGLVLTSGLQLGIAAAHHGAGDRVRQGARAVRPADRFVPGGEAPRRRHARALRSRARCGVRGRVHARRPEQRRPRRAAAAAKVVAGDAALANAKACIQVHGGIGYTWELDVQRYWKRATVLDTHFGNSERWAEAVAATI